MDKRENMPGRASLRYSHNIPNFSSRDGAEEDKLLGRARANQARASTSAQTRSPFIYWRASYAEGTV